MARNSVYKAIVDAVMEGGLEEPFSSCDFRESCPKVKEGTYNAFLWKHRKGNPGECTELFELVGPNSFKLIRPIKYGAKNGND
jgi:hypothetical protein